MQRKKNNHSNLFTTLILIAGLFLMAFGIFREEVPVMFEKSINICLECIGIG